MAACSFRTFAFALLCVRAPLIGAQGCGDEASGADCNVEALDADEVGLLHVRSASAQQHEVEATSVTSTCVPDKSCAPENVNLCCSGKRYYSADAPLSCGIGSKTECDVCEDLVNLLLSQDTCDATTAVAEAGCSDTGLPISGLCSAIATKGCELLQGQAKSDNLVNELCTTEFGLCDSDLSGYFCGCLPAGQCVDPDGAGSDCCSGQWSFNGLGEPCGKDWNNNPSPARCD
mmetsp:Transcript_68162/g.171727  ORF Transcript_68162/g.171727 Transcript_68162/m.171727 type:complete len:232 (-) Transcript_68162:140-835(-)